METEMEELPELLVGGVVQREAVQQPACARRREGGAVRGQRETSVAATTTAAMTATATAMVTLTAVTVTEVTTTATATVVAATATVAEKNNNQLKPAAEEAATAVNAALASILLAS